MIGTFFVMSVFGFSMNNFSLFGLVLAVGIVVDDAIVVVENVERHLGPAFQSGGGRLYHHGRSRRGAYLIALVLIAVFVPTAFLNGISGQFSASSR